MGTDYHEGLIKFLVKDGELSAQENGYLSKLRGGLDDTKSGGYSDTVMVLDQLEKANPKGYKQVCFEIGESYLFYYDISVEKDKYSAAATWFQYAQDDYPIAKMYCDISNCLQNISKYSKAGQMGKLDEEYKNLWNQITELNNNAENNFENDTEGLDLKLRVWNEIVNMINNNASYLCQVSSPNQVINLLNGIFDKSSQITNSFLKDSIQKLKNNIEETIKKVNSINDK